MTKNARQTSKKNIKEKLSQGRLLGEIITWQAAGEHSRTAVIEALRASGLPEEAAPEFSVKTGFDRAAKKLTENRLIEEVPSPVKDDEVIYQLTAKVLKDVTGGDEARELEYQKEGYVRLNKDTGKIRCKNAKVREAFQSMLDKEMETRYASDVTQSIRRLLDKADVDLFPLKDSGHVYFVPVAHTAFLDKIEAFCESLGGKLDRFPIPAGEPKAEKAIKNTVATAINSLIKQQETVIDGFTGIVHKSSLEKAAEKIKTGRVKIEAYAHYLGEQQKALLTSLDALNEKLRDKVKEASEARIFSEPEPGKKKPGVNRAVLKMLISASEDDPITAEEIWEECKKIFPERDHAKMLVYIKDCRWWAEHEFGLKVHRNESKGMWIDYPNGEVNAAAD